MHLVTYGADLVFVHTQPPCPSSALHTKDHLTASSCHPLPEYFPSIAAEPVHQEARSAGEFLLKEAAFNQWQMGSWWISVSASLPPPPKVEWQISSTVSPEILAWLSCGSPCPSPLLASFFSIVPPHPLPGVPRGSLQITYLHLKLCLRISFWKNLNQDNLFSILLDIFPHVSKTEAKSFQSKPWLMTTEAEGLILAAWSGFSEWSTQPTLGCLPVLPVDSRSGHF